MYRDIEEKLAARKQVKYADKFICGLPVGLKLPNGIIIGASNSCEDGCIFGIKL